MFKYFYFIYQEFITFIFIIKILINKKSIIFLLILFKKIGIIPFHIYIYNLFSYLYNSLNKIILLTIKKIIPKFLKIKFKNKKLKILRFSKKIFFIKKEINIVKLIYFSSNKNIKLFIKKRKYLENNKIIYKKFLIYIYIFLKNFWYKFNIEKYKNINILINIIGIFPLPLFFIKVFILIIIKNERIFKFFKKFKGNKLIYLYYIKIIFKINKYIWQEIYVYFNFLFLFFKIFKKIFIIKI